MTKVSFMKRELMLRIKKHRTNVSLFVHCSKLFRKGERVQNNILFIVLNFEA